MCISIHAPRTGSDNHGLTGHRRIHHFNPRSPHGERLYCQIKKEAMTIFQSTLPARGATISGTPYKQTSDISIHAPRTGSDASEDEHFAAINEFQSTLPARGATIIAVPLRRRFTNFNPRSPHGERLFGSLRSPHSSGFQSTLPARGATLACNLRRIACYISIHAPRTGSDALTSDCYSESVLFQSTLPARGATSLVSADTRFLIFQSTLPARGATIVGCTLPQH